MSLINEQFETHSARIIAALVVSDLSTIHQ